MGDEGRWGLRNISLAAVPRVAVYLMEAAVSRQRVVETWHAAMETALLCSSVNHAITPVISSAAQAAVVAGFAVDTAGFTLGRCGLSMVTSDRLIKVIKNS